MEVYCVLLEWNNGSSDVMSDIIPCETLKKARSVLNRKMNAEAKKHDKNSLMNGKLFRDEDAFAFYDVCGGDWAFRGTIYKRELKK